MRKIATVLGLAFASMAFGPLVYAEDSISVGGDVYSSGSTAKLANAAPRDTFVSGFSVSLTGNTANDAHAAGFDVDVEGAIGEDLYAAGGSVKIAAPVTQDLTVAGFNVRLSEKAVIGGNARIAAGAIEIEGPISGSLLATGGKVTLNSTVAGDVRVTAGDLEFGPTATISGTLTYSTPGEIEIPERVITPDKVKYVQFDKNSWTSEIRKAVEDTVPTFWPTLARTIAAFLIILGFFVAIAAACFAFIPDRVERLTKQVQSRPGSSLLFGYLGLATLIGLMPTSAITIIGLPFVPVVILLIIIFWLLGYLLGSFAIADRIWTAFGKSADTVPVKLFVVASSLTVLAILNFIPVVGWLINLTIVFVGLGAITWSIVQRLLDFDNGQQSQSAGEGAKT